MKRLVRNVLAIAIALAGVALADDIDDGARRAFQGLASSWSGESAGGVCSYFPAGDAKVSVSVGGRSGEFSREQAKGVLEQYFRGVQVTRVTLRRDGYHGGGRRYSATYDYEYATQDGHEHSGFLQFSIESRDGRWVLQSVRAD